MSPPKSRPQMDASIIRRPGQAAPIQAPSYTRVETVPEPAPLAPPPVAAPAPIPAPPLVSPAPAPALAPAIEPEVLSPPSPAAQPARVEGKPSDSMPWLGGRPWTRKLGIRVDEDRVRRIKIVAASRGATMEELLVEAIDQYMERYWPEVSRGLR